jgi:Lon protease-like protein
LRAGNAHYRGPKDLPTQIPVFPLSAALLLPGGRMPLNIFEPRYLAMIDAALSGDRMIGIIQPRLDGGLRADGEPELCDTGCLGRITSFAETGDGRYVISLEGVCRFRLIEEVAVRTPFRQCRVTSFAHDLQEDAAADQLDRDALLKTFKAYLDANGLEADWDSIRRAENSTLVNALSMMSPYGAAEKQALLDAPDLKTRAETLIAITEMALARDDDEFPSSLQ